MKHRSIPDWSLLVILVVMMAAPSTAHEGHHHNAMGTVHAIQAAQLDLETKDGTLATFVLDEKTTYKRGDNGARREDVRVGERAVVMYEVKEGKNVALEVKLPRDK